MTTVPRIPAARGLLLPLAAATMLAAACDRITDSTANQAATTLKGVPCTGAASVITLTSTQTARIDCSNGGTTATFAGSGASYLIVAQFPTDQLANQFYLYNVATGKTSTTASASRAAARARLGNVRRGGGTGLAPLTGSKLAQLGADRTLRSRAAASASAATSSSSMLRALRGTRSGAVAPPAVGTVRSFHVASNAALTTWKSVGAKLSFVGTNVLIYIDTLAPGGGYSPTQLANYGTLYDQTLYPIDTTAFGSPTDIDNNGRVIVLMSPVVNADTPVSTCGTAGGYIQGFFDFGDYASPATNPNSNQGEIFYTVVPDPTGAVSCTHTVADLALDIPATFLHELQHLISYSQHVVVHGGSALSGWMDEGLSIVAEELGSLYYEQKCPPPNCRSDANSLVPDSSKAFLYSAAQTSYQYALLPDTASITVPVADGNAFSSQGGAWLLMRWLGDQYGASIFKQFENGPANAVASIEQATGQPFPSLFANFGLALYTDSLPGLPRATAAPVNRFTTRNVKLLWAATYSTFGPSQAYPYVDPLFPFPVTNDTSSTVLVPGGMSFFRLDTPTSAATTTIQFSGPAGAALATSLKPQLAIFRLPTGQ